MKYIDVSQWQGVIDWERIKGRVDGVMIRAGYGKGTLDTYFHRNASECRRLGIPFGAYWFSYAYTPEMARNEADRLLKSVEPFEVELPLAFDWEYSSRDNAVLDGVTPTMALVQSMTREFCDTIEKAGYWCMVYTNADYINKYFGSLAGGRYDLWLAQWPKIVDVRKPPRQCGIWQWGGSEIPGIEGDVDTNEAYKDYATMLREKGCNHLTPKPAPPVPAEPEPWYAKAMAWAQDNGLCDGTRPDDFATRAEIVQMLYTLKGGK